MTLIMSSNMQGPFESYNSTRPNKLINEINEKLKHRSKSKNSDFESRDSVESLDKSEQCSTDSVTPTNKSRFNKSPFKSFFKRENKPALKTISAEVPPQKEPENLYYVPAGDDQVNPSVSSRNVQDEADIYEEVQVPSPSLDKTTTEKEIGSRYQNITARHLRSEVCPDRKNRKQSYSVNNLPDDGEVSEHGGRKPELELHDTEAWGHTYDSIDQDEKHSGTNANLKAERVPKAVLRKLPVHADSSVRKTPPPTLPKTVCIKRSSSEKIHEEWCKLNDSASQHDKQVPPAVPTGQLNKQAPPVLDKSVPPVLNKPAPHADPSVPPVPAKPPLSSLPPKKNKELPEIKKELKLFRKLLNQQKDVDITKIEISNVNFTGRIVDSRGGRLQLKSHGVVLYIPPGALGDEPQEIFVYVQQNLTSSSQNGFVTPIVHCGTSGLKFNIPVILSFPVHVKDSSQWKLSGVRQDSSTEPWADIPDCSSDTILVNDNLCTVVVDHFTGFGLVGCPNVPQPSLIPIRIKVYNSQTNGIDPVHGCVKLQVYFCDESTETCESIKEREKDSKLLLDKSRGFFLHVSNRGPNNANLDVTFELECLNQLWKTSFKKQVFSLARCDVDQFEESCTLNLKVRPQEAAMGADYRPLECEIGICQSSYEEFGVTVRVVDEIGVRSERESMDYHGMSILRLNEFDPMSLGRCRKLSHKLDSERRWRLLVKPCFIGQEAERDFDKHLHPSSAVLGIVFLQGLRRRESSMMTLVRLESMLNECKLFRAAQLVHDDIEELKEKCSGKDNGEVFVHSIQCSDDVHSDSDEAKLHVQRPIRNPVKDDDDVYELISSDFQGGNNDERASNHLQNRIPEENDENPNQIRTLQSNPVILPDTGPNNSRSLRGQRQSQEPVQNDWPSEHSRYQNVPLKASSDRPSNNGYTSFTVGNKKPK
ncbi:uncharacterized protein LOC117300829 isoform X2 [Asterias rubens]|uniref:uncharacterized protein LOC117300829 isoform X2 n=1 Tax=Asterias rubens TaxID=7604 RepID=UPI0014553B20|nr:uncharacterized protein LOC117300829 isoform X2 [Asterias rubens]